MSLPEKTFQDQIIALAKRMGVLVYHTYDSRRSVRGFPDLVIVGARGVLWRELKTDTGRISADQKHWIESLRAAGCDADVWRPSKDWPTRVQREIAALGRLNTRPPVPSQAQIRKQLAKRSNGTDFFPPSP